MGSARSRRCLPTASALPGVSSTPLRRMRRRGSESRGARSASAGMIVPRARSGLCGVAVAAVGAVALAALAILRHDRYGSGGFDLGIFDQQVWSYAHFRVGPNTVKRTHDLLGDHFHPILVLLAPLYWLWDDVRALLVAQAVLLAG